MQFQLVGKNWNLLLIASGCLNTACCLSRCGIWLPNETYHWLLQVSTASIIFPNIVRDIIYLVLVPYMVVSHIHTREFLVTNFAREWPFSSVCFYVSSMISWCCWLETTEIARVLSIYGLHSFQIFLNTWRRNSWMLMRFLLLHEKYFQKN